MTYATLPALAKKSNVRLVDRRFEEGKHEKNARLGVLNVHTAWQGDYEELPRSSSTRWRRASPFVIIDDVTLTQSDLGQAAADAHHGALPYFRLGTNGT